jgi:hypothetical protein
VCRKRGESEETRGQLVRVYSIDARGKGSKGNLSSVKKSS